MDPRPVKKCKFVWKMFYLISSANLRFSSISLSYNSLSVEYSSSVLLKDLSMSDIRFTVSNFSSTSFFNVSLAVSCFWNVHKKLGSTVRIQILNIWIMKHIVNELRKFCYCHRLSVTVKTESGIQNVVSRTLHLYWLNYNRHSVNVPSVTGNIQLTDF